MVTVYTDRTIKIFIFVDTWNVTGMEIASLNISEEDYAKLADFVDRERIEALVVEPNEDVLDDASYYITLYDEKNEELISVGGYMPDSDEFWVIYRGINDILGHYNINEIMDAHREELIESTKRIEKSYSIQKKGCS